MALGFTRRQAEDALHGAFGVLEHAIEACLRAGEQAEAAHQDQLSKTRSARSAERTKLPPYWTPIGDKWDGNKTLRVELPADSVEFRNVADRFHATCPRGQWTITHVTRIQSEPTTAPPPPLPDSTR